MMVMLVSDNCFCVLLHHSLGSHDHFCGRAGGGGDCWGRRVFKKMKDRVYVVTAVRTVNKPTMTRQVKSESCMMQVEPLLAT